MRRETCPCCGYPTLEERGNFEICILCNWEDDGQDDPYADEVWGGPNGDYSLTEARKNYMENHTMYRDKKNSQIQTDEILKIYRELVEYEPNSSEYKTLWSKIRSYKKLL